VPLELAAWPVRRPALVFAFVSEHGWAERTAHLPRRGDFAGTAFPCAKARANQEFPAMPRVACRATSEFRQLWPRACQLEGGDIVPRNVPSEPRPRVLVCSWRGLWRS